MHKVLIPAPSTCTLPPLTGDCRCGAQSADEAVNSSCVQPNLGSLEKGVLAHKLSTPPLSIGTSRSQMFSITSSEQKNISQRKLREKLLLFDKDEKDQTNADEKPQTIQ